MGEGRHFELTAERRATLFVAMIFVSGMLLGGTLMNLAEHFWLHADGMEASAIEARTRALAAALRLTQQQAGQVDQILRTTAERYQSMDLELAPQFDAVQRQAREQLRSLLDDTQRRQFDLLVGDTAPVTSSHHCSGAAVATR